MAKLARNSQDLDPTRPRRKLWGGVLALLLVGGVCLFAWKWFVPATRVSVVEPIEPPTVDDQRVDKAVADAVRTAREAVVASPTDANRWGELGSVFLAHDFRAQAMTCLEQAAALDPTEPRWPYLHANSLLMTAPRDSIPLLEQTVKLCGNDPAAPRLTLVEVLLEQHELDEAERHLHQYMAQNPGDPRARLSLGRLLFMRKDYDGCARTLMPLAREFEEQQRLPGHRRTLSLLLAESLQRSGQGAEAQSIREKANRQIDSQWPDPFLDDVKSRRTGLKSTLVKADLVYGAGNYEESIRLLREAVDSYPESLWAKIYLARALIRTGSPQSPYPDREARLRQAVELLQAALETDPDSVEALFRLGVAITYQNNHKRAAVLFQKAVDLKPDFTMAYYNLARSKYKLKDSDAAIRALQMAVKTEPNFVQGYRMLGVLLMANRRYEEAERELQNALRLSPDDQEVAKLYAEAQRLKASVNN